MQNRALMIALKASDGTVKRALHALLGLALALVIFHASPVRAVGGSQTRTPASVADCTDTGGGAVAWTNPGNAASSDNVYAITTLDGQISNTLQCLNYGFSIPTGATILGIEVNIERKSSATPGSDDASVSLVKAGTVQGSDLQTNTAYPTADTVEVHGGSTQLWGLAWTPADINAANFGAAFRAQKASAAGAAQIISVDEIEITVYYSTPSQARTPAAAGNCTAIAGTGANWTNPGNAFSPNDTYATVNVDGTTSDALQCLNYGFTIPAGATILGIEVNIERKSNSTANGGSNDASVRLVKGGVVGGSNLATATIYGTGDKIEAHGSATQLWGQTWTPADINAANFGVQYTGTKPSAAGGAHTLSIDQIQIVVTYSQPPPAPNLVSPADNAVVTTGTPALDWSDVVDPDGETVTYDVQADNSGCTFPSPEVNQTGLATSNFTPGAALADGTYCWRARAVDQSNVAGAWSTTRNFTINTVGAFNAVETGAANNTTIRTKLAGTSFSLDILAIKAGAIHTGYLGTVAVEIVNAATGGGVCANMTQLQSTGNLTFAASDSGRKSISFTFASAVANARIRITDSSVNITSCSSDGFSIRPASFAVASNMTNGGTSGNPVIAAGANFTITATTTTGYDGTPSIDSTKVAAHAGAVQTGTIGGSFSAGNPATGVATGTTFTYTEVGNFTIAQDGVHDDAFTSVDQPNDCNNDFTTTLSGGKYGCKIGSAATSAIGRFKPDHFAVSSATVTNRAALSCSSTFTYMDERLDLVFTLTAQNTSNGTTKNYEGSYATLVLTTPANFNLGARSGSTVFKNGAFTPTNRVSATASSGTWSSGAATNITIQSGILRNTSGSVVDGPYTAVNFGIAPTDGDGVAMNTLDLDTNTTAGNDTKNLGVSTEVRFGRLRQQNAAASSGALVLPVPMELQYWNGSAFTINSGLNGDICTPPPSVTLSGATFTPAGSTIVSSVTFGTGGATGTGTIRLSAPGAANRGFVLVTPTVPAYLQGNWTGASWNQNPSNRAAWGVFGAQPQNFIFQRENY